MKRILCLLVAVVLSGSRATWAGDDAICVKDLLLANGTVISNTPVVGITSSNIAVRLTGRGAVVTAAYDFAELSADTASDIKSLQVERSRWIKLFRKPRTIELANGTILTNVVVRYADVDGLHYRGHRNSGVVGTAFRGYIAAAILAEYADYIPIISSETRKIEAVVIEDIPTAGGFVYHNASVVETDPSGIIIAYEGGRTRIPFERLAPSVREKYGYNPDDARAFDAERDVEMALFVKSAAEEGAWANRRDKLLSAVGKGSIDARLRVVDRTQDGLYVTGAVLVAAGPEARGGRLVDLPGTTVISLPKVYETGNEWTGKLYPASDSWTNLDGCVLYDLYATGIEEAVSAMLPSFVPQYVPYEPTKDKEREVGVVSVAQKKQPSEVAKAMADKDRSAGLGTGMLHGLTAPARLFKIKGMKFIDSGRRSNEYKIGVIAGVLIDVLILFYLMDLLARKKK